MSEVKRYVHKPEKMQKISRFYGPNSERQYVQAVDFDAAQAALREELAEIKQSLSCRGSLLGRTEQRLTVAEQRNAELEGLLRHTSQLACERMDLTLEHAVKATLKPTESGATKQKICIECDQPYCHGVCVERGDDDVKYAESGASE